MKKHYFLGAAANFKHPFRHIFAGGSEKDARKLEVLLGEKYGGEAILMKNGRSALAVALMAYFNKGDKVIVNGFTCYAVVEAIKAAGLTPVYADIEAENLNFSARTLEDAYARGGEKITGVIVQNTLGNPVDIAGVLKFCKKHGLVLIEDLAHSVGVKYQDGREAGTIGAGVAFSFGKEKSIDTILGGAVVLRDFEAIKGARFDIPRNAKKMWVSEFRPRKRPHTSDNLRARFYPLFGALYRGLSYVKLNGVLMQLLLKTHLVQRSADNRLELKRKISDFEARAALKKFQEMKTGAGVLREFYLLDNRDEVLAKLREAGYFFDGFWYEKPISPERYYKKLRFPEKDCPIATAVSRRIINFPTYYSKKELAEARKIVREVGEIWNMNEKKEDKK